MRSYRACSMAVMLVSLDPGLRQAGVACWDDGELTTAFLVKGANWFDTATEVKKRVFACASTYLLDVVIEQPQVYHQSKQKGDPEDLIKLALMGGATAALISPHAPMMYEPQTWKGSVPKEVTTARTRRRITDEEQHRIELPRAVTLQHNVWDAIGIGLFHLKRRQNLR